MTIPKADHTKKLFSLTYIKFRFFWNVIPNHKKSQHSTKLYLPILVLQNLQYFNNCFSLSRACPSWEKEMYKCSGQWSFPCQALHTALHFIFQPRQIFLTIEIHMSKFDVKFQNAKHGHLLLYITMNSQKTTKCKSDKNYRKNTQQTLLYKLILRHFCPTVFNQKRYKYWGWISHFRYDCYTLSDQKMQMTWPHSRQQFIYPT